VSNTSQFDFPSPVSSIYSQNSRFAKQLYKNNNNYNESVIFHNIGDTFNLRSKGIWEMAIQEILSISYYFLLDFL